MDQKVYDTYVSILKSELVPALGCTEPIAIAYASAKARDVLSEMPERLELWCSGNIIKNVKGVVVPNSGGLHGIDVAGILGLVGGNPNKELEVLESVTQADIDRTKELLQEDFCSCHLIENVENLFIVAKVFKGEHSAEVEIANRHTNITRIVKDGEEWDVGKHVELAPHQAVKLDKSLLNVKDILEFADCVKIDDVREVLDRQIEMNSAISKEGLSGDYGAEVGKTLLKYYGNDVKIRARAAAAAGSDARMGGCSLPVVINSGSGNQGMTVSLPVIEYAKELGVSHEKLYRALAVSNLVSIHQKKYIGSLSAYCGAVSAACGSGAAITYLYGGDLDDVSMTITNTIANVGGIVCDGAKSSCAAKIASAVDAAVMAHCMTENSKTFRAGEGLVKDDVEGTIESLGRVGREGMKATDIEILNIMIEK
ncbi:serine dehydratase subunit alpha family protein [Anaerotruncus sp.]|uniref:L-cysteine desulfidase family protein n=1 Tax=Anaerotruncus TaxID=244127 RepID=UPI0021740DEB|nr:MULTISPECIES: L-serine ammonia-lyase, iron-sulfur-dependent, subunit alpha [Anaerotruncus]MCI8492380.1 serine dehydratase subunit alpha family protein [Anaerotruncus sp.]